MARSWKAVELALARLLGGERVPVSGRTRGYAPDIEHPWLALEVKSWAHLPARIADAMDQAEKAAAWALKRNPKSDKLPVVVIHGDRQPYGKSLVVMRLQDFMGWFGDYGDLATPKEE